MDRFFSTRMASIAFLRNTLIASLLGLVILLPVYVLVTPGFAGHLSSGGMVLSRWLRQVITNGLPVVFVVNYVGFFLFAVTMEKSRSVRAMVLFVVLDPLLRVVLFIALHAVIYMLSADWFGSFGGSKTTALGVVAPTLARSAWFENISGAYLYAVLLSALPVYATVFDRLDGRGASPGHWPVRVWPWGVGVLTCAVCAALLMAMTNTFL